MVEMGSGRRAIDWYGRLTLCLPLVFLIGAPSVLITRAIFSQYYPSHFVHDSPTISETASQTPSSGFFEWTMFVVTFCIIVSWFLNLVRNSRRLSDLATGGIDAHGLTVVNWTASLMGILAGCFLALVSVYNLTDGHDVHMFGSWGFYISQALSITFDIIFVLWMRRYAMGPTEKDGLWGRVAVAMGIFVGSWFFLFMYESKGYAAPDHKYAVQLVYVGAEYTVCMLFLIYPMTAYAEIRRHFREFALH